MNIDWNCKAAECRDWALLNAEIGMIHFYSYRPSNNGISWNCKGVSGEPSYKHYTLHERPKSEQMKETIYTKEMHAAGELPKAGMKCVFFAGSKLGGGDFVEGTCLSVAKKSNGENVIMFEYTHNDSTPIDCTLFSDDWVKPIDKRTDKEKAIDDLNYVLMNEVAGKTTRQIAEHIVNKLEYLTFTGDK